MIRKVIKGTELRLVKVAVFKWKILTRFMGRRRILPKLPCKSSSLRGRLLRGILGRLPLLGRLSNLSSIRPMIEDLNSKGRHSRNRRVGLCRCCSDLM